MYENGEVQIRKRKPKESASVNVGSRRSSSAEAANAANPSSLKSRKRSDVVSICTFTNMTMPSIKHFS